ncbi:MAG: sodium:calcium antiporter [Acidobacteria bacterium]|nr:sodium:calcium antiporter [Acidobacteriota bacterium]
MWQLIGMFGGLAALTVIAGYYLACLGDTIAEETGFGHNIVGFVLLAAITSLPELSTSITGASLGQAELVFGNMVGSNIFNILIIGLILIGMGRKIRADDHVRNILSGAMGIAMAGIAGMLIVLKAGYSGIVLIGAYLVMMVIHYRFERKKIFSLEGPAPAFHFQKLAPVYLKFLFFSVIIVITGYLMTGICDRIAVTPFHVGEKTLVLGRTFVGQMFLAVATSLPELIVSFSAVKLGKIDMAYANVFGSNIFNMSILGISALVYRGNMFADVGIHIYFSFFVFILMVSIAIISLKYKMQNKIRWDGLAILGLFLLNALYLFNR